MKKGPFRGPFFIRLPRLEPTACNSLRVTAIASDKSFASLSVSPVGASPELGVRSVDPHIDSAAEKERQAPIKPASRRGQPAKFSKNAIGAVIEEINGIADLK